MRKGTPSFYREKSFAADLAAAHFFRFLPLRIRISETYDSPREAARGALDFNRRQFGGNAGRRLV
jgi:hypothetical protein